MKKKKGERKSILTKKERERKKRMLISPLLDSIHHGSISPRRQRYYRICSTLVDYTCSLCGGQNLPTPPTQRLPSTTRLHTHTLWLMLGMSSCMSLSVFMVVSISCVCERRVAYCVDKLMHIVNSFCLSVYTYI